MYVVFSIIIFLYVCISIDIDIYSLNSSCEQGSWRVNTGLKPRNLNFGSNFGYTVSIEIKRKLWLPHSAIKV